MSISKAEQLISKRSELTLDELEALPVPDLANEKFAPTGPAKVARDRLLTLRDQLTTTARSAGYPDRTDKGFREFDYRAAVLLYHFGVPLGQALRSDVWAWIAVDLVPHLVEWRWGKSEKTASVRRYGGIIQRNGIGRLWYRAHVMVDRSSKDPWTVLRLVNEDAHVQVLERTSVSKDTRVAKYLLEQWIRAGGGEAVLRNSVIRIRVKTMLIEVSVLSEQQLRALIDETIQQAKRHLLEKDAA